MTDAESEIVLVVDDEPQLAEIFSLFLSTEYEVRTATSGAQALEEAEADVDVILLDRRMPEMTGDEVLAELHEREVDAMVGMITGVDPERDIVDMAFDDYLTKPVEKEDLLSFVENLLLRSTYDERGQEYFSLASKKAVLKAADNDDSAEYRELVDQLNELRDEIDGCLDAVFPTAKSLHGSGAER